jgi:hypothetical protein
MPLHPQVMFVMGAKPITRTVLNAGIKVASYVPLSEKLIPSVKFASLEEVQLDVDISQLPTHVRGIRWGGGGAGFNSSLEYVAWIRNCVTNFPSTPMF